MYDTNPNTPEATTVLALQSEIATKTAEIATLTRANESWTKYYDEANRKHSALQAAVQALAEAQDAVDEELLGSDEWEELFTHHGISDPRKVDVTLTFTVIRTMRCTVTVEVSGVSKADIDEFDPAVDGFSEMTRRDIDQALTLGVEYDNYTVTEVDIDDDDIEVDDIEVTTD